MFIRTSDLLSRLVTTDLNLAFFAYREPLQETPLCGCSTEQVHYGLATDVVSAAEGGSRAEEPLVLVGYVRC